MKSETEKYQETYWGRAGQWIKSILKLRMWSVKVWSMKPKVWFENNELEARECIEI